MTKIQMTQTETFVDASDPPNHAGIVMIRLSPKTVSGSHAKSQRRKGKGAATGALGSQAESCHKLVVQAGNLLLVLNPRALRLSDFA